MWLSGMLQVVPDITFHVRPLHSVSCKATTQWSTFLPVSAVLSKQLTADYYLIVLEPLVCDCIQVYASETVIT